MINIILSVGFSDKILYKKVNEKELLKLFSNSKNIDISLNLKLNNSNIYIEKFINVFLEYRKSVKIEYNGKSVVFYSDFKNIKSSSRGDKIILNNNIFINIEKVENIFVYDDYLMLVLNDNEKIVLD